MRHAEASFFKVIKAHKLEYCKKKKLSDAENIPGKQFKSLAPLLYTTWDEECHEVCLFFFLFFSVLTLVLDAQL